MHRAFDRPPTVRMEAHEESPTLGRHVDLDFFAFSWKLQTQLNQVQAA